MYLLLMLPDLMMHLSASAASVPLSMIATAVGMAMLAAVLLLRPQLVQPWQLCLVTLLGTAGLVEGSLRSAQSATGNVGPLMFVLRILHVGSMRNRWETWLYVVWGLALYAHVLSDLPDRGPAVVNWVVVAGILALLTGAVTWCRSYVDDLVAELRRQADHDPLTGLPDRSGLMRRLAPTSPSHDILDVPTDTPGKVAGHVSGRGAHGDTREAMTGVLVIDVDHFKAINDRHGRLVGDEALMWLAGLLRGALPTPAVTARFGGEEFIVILPGHDVAEAWARAEHVRALVATSHSARGVAMTISIGVACRSAGGAFVEAFARADEAVYAAERNGRNRVEVWQQTEPALVVEDSTQQEPCRRLAALPPAEPTASATSR